MTLKKFFLTALVAMGLNSGFASALAAQSTPREVPPYLDPTQPPARRAQDLLRRMTLKEKVGQLNMPCVYLPEMGADIPAKLAACKRFAEGTYTNEIGPGGGFFDVADEVLLGSARSVAEYFNLLQRIAVEKTRLKIPLLETEEGTHGAMFPGATSFPEGPAIGSTWDMDLVRTIYATVAQEARGVGIHELCTLVIEPDRDPRLGRNQEGFTEDPYLAGRIAQEIVRGGQGDSVAANDKDVTVLCHFPGQSEPVSGLETGAMEISQRALRETYLIPWVEGIEKAQALGVMATYPEIDDVPTHSSEKLLTQILREELGFKGLALSEGGGFGSLIWQELVTTQKEAGALALKAGVDVGISYERGYMEDLIANVEEGRVPMALVDRAVLRVLEQKFRLGLFDHPYVDVDRASAVLHSQEHQELARRAAREGIVLLKNEHNLLPLRKDLKSIAVIGPDSDAPINQLGDYSPLHNGPATLQDVQHIVTVVEGITAKVPRGTQVVHVKGCGVLGDDKSGFADAVQAAKNAEVAIVVVGEQYGKPDVKDPNTWPTDGEGHDVASLDLTGVQADLIRAVYATGTPTVVVLINGRPLSIRWTAEHVPAIVEAWLPGERGGEAVADVLFGDYNPSGRLAISVPRSVGQLPDYYNYKPSKDYRTTPGPAIAGPDRGVGYVDMPASPLYPFGYGLSYTKFEYSGLRISPPQIRPAANVQVSLIVKNIGAREGTDVAQLYIHHLTGSVTTPIKELRAFQRVTLKPAEQTTVTFTLTPEDLALLNRDMHWVVESGDIEIMTGESAEDIRLKGNLRVIE